MKEETAPIKTTAGEDAARWAFFQHSNCRATEPHNSGCIHGDEGCSCLRAAREIIAAYKGAESGN